MKKLICRDGRSKVEKQFDENLELRLSEADSLEEISAILTLMERRAALSDKRRISPDTVMVVAGNLLGIVLIMSYERGNVITTKALGFVLRGRV